MLPVWVDGKGLIGRGYGLAPRKTIINAGKDLMEFFLSNPNITPVHVDPETKKSVRINRENYEKILQRYNEKRKEKKVDITPNPVKEEKQITPPVVSNPTVVPPPPPVPPSIVPITPEETKKEETSDVTPTNNDGVTEEPINENHPVVSEEKKDERPQRENSNDFHWKKNKHNR